MHREDLNSAFAGLFWFDNKYSKVEDVVGVVEIVDGDIASRREIFPNGFHTDYIKGEKRPRGRVSLMRGGIIINVGLKCPDEAIGLVIEAFGLDKHKNIVRVVKGYHWDDK